MCAWRYTVRINGLDRLAITKLDVLDQFDQIKVCVANHNPANKQTYKELPSIGSTFHDFEPVYETLPGWQTSTRHCRQAKDLPQQAKDYLDFLSKQLDIPIAVVSIGPEREDTIVIEDPIHGPKRMLVSSSK